MLSYEEFVESVRIASNGYLVLVFIALTMALLFLFINRHLGRFFSDIKPVHIPLMFSLITGLAIRLPSLFESFWYDETFTANVARLNIVDAMTVILSDVHPPLAYLPFWIIGQFTTVEWILRIPSLIAGIAIIYLAYSIGKHWSEPVAEYSAFFVAIMPALVWYSAEARAYSILTAISLLAVDSILKKKQNTFYVAIALLPLLHAYGYLHSFVLGVVWLWQNRNVKTFFQLIGSAIPALLWLPFLLAQTTDVSDGFWITPPTWGMFLSIFTEDLIGSAYPEVVAVFVLPLTITIIILALWHNRNEYTLLILLFTVPILTFLVSVLWSPIFLYRALLPSVVILIFILAKWAVNAPRMAMVFVAILAMVMIMKLHPHAQRTPIRDFVDECGDMPVYTVSLEAGIIANYYSDNPVYLFTSPNNLNQSLPVLARNAMGFEHRAIAPRDTCIYWQDTVMTTDEQRENLALSLNMRGDYDRMELYEARTIVIEVYR